MARAVSVRSVTESLRRAKSDARIGGVLVVPAGLSSPYWAKLQEVRDAIADFRRSGKPAYAFLEYGGQAEYFVASTCNRVFLLPTSVLDLTGLASYELFLRGTLDKIGAHPDMVHIGQYKSAVNQLTETTFTPAHREMAESLNRDLFEQLVRGVADGRRRSERDIQALVDEGPFLSEDAVRAGLVDDLAYEDEAFKKLEDASRARNRVELADYARTGGSMFDFAPRFALIYVTGTITSGRSGFDPLSGATVGSESLVEHLRAVREDASIRAVILRIDSPGGSAVASDVIWRELTLAARRETETPARGLDVGPGRLRRLLHRHGGAHDRRRARHVDGIDRDLRRQGGARRHLQQARRNNRRGEQRPPRGHELAGPALHRRRARQARGPAARVLRAVRREGRQAPAT